MTQAFRTDETGTESGANAGLEQRLRTSLRDARGNLEIRRRLVRVAGDPESFAALQRSLGPGHALLRDLRRLLPGAPAAVGAGRPSGDAQRRLGSSPSPS